MNKVALLKQRAIDFKRLLEQHEAENIDAMLLLKWLTPLFQEIERGNVCPPMDYEFGDSLGKDNPFYEPDKPFHSCEAAFVAALEDWESQDWYKNLQNARL